MEQTRYTVPGWGVGELWTSDGVVLAHDFTFVGAVVAAANVNPVASAFRAGPPIGVEGPLSGTVPVIPARMGHGSVPNSEHVAVGQRHIDPGVLVERFAAFFAGDDVHFGDIALDLSWATPFQHAVAACLRSVPRGEVVSYGELAALAGHPGAPRAVGTFCAGNRFLLLLPCHRVVGAAGIGGYGSAGVTVKRRLLALEGVHL